jgi:CRP-like cAMP-binding protein
MRAARAAKEFQEAQGDLAAHLEYVVSLDSNGNSLDYILQSLIPLLKIVFSELCQKKPENPSAFLGIWLLEQCGAPASAVADLHKWIQSGEIIADPAKRILENGGFKVPATSSSTDSPLDAETKAKIMAKAAQDMAIHIPDDTTDNTDAEISPSQVSPPVTRPPENDSANPRKAAMRASLDNCENVRPSSPMGCLKKGQPSAPEAAVKQQDADGDTLGDLPAKDVEPASPGKPAERRRLSFWSQPKVQEKAESSDSEGDVQDQEVAGATQALLELRHLSEKHATSKHDEEQRCRTGDRRRRFTVALSSTDCIAPPQEELSELLRNVTMFKDLEEKDILELAKVIRCRKFEPDEAIVDFGGACEDLHVVVEGTAKVSVAQQIGQVKRGDFFGDQSLRVTGATHASQVVAQGTPVTTISISASDFAELPFSNRLHLHGQGGQKDRVARNMRGDQGAEDKPKSLPGGVCEASGLTIVEDYVQTEEDIELIIGSLKNNKVLGEVLTLSDDQMRLLADAMHVVELPAHETLLSKGDHGTALFIVLEGLLNVTLDENLHGEFKIRVGDSFGELSLMYDTPRTATIVAARKCKLFVLPRYEFRIVVRMSYSDRLVQYSELIQQIPCLHNMVDVSNVDLIAGALEDLSCAD